LLSHQLSHQRNLASLFAGRSAVHADLSAACVSRGRATVLIQQKNGRKFRCAGALSSDPEGIELSSQQNLRLRWALIISRKAHRATQSGGCWSPCTSSAPVVEWLWLPRKWTFPSEISCRR